MDAAHVVILQRNHKYLKKMLQVDPVLDALYQDCVFTQVDYDRCRQAGGEKCEMLLEILKKKGVEGYRTLCTVLDTTQPFIKKRLDGTSTEAGLTSVIFVNKGKLEAQHRKEIEEYEKQIALLQSDINDLKQQLEQPRGIQETLEKTKHKEAKDHISQIKEQGVHIELQFHLAKSQGDLLKANEKCDRLKKVVSIHQQRWVDLEKIVCKLLGVNLQEHTQTQMVASNRDVQPGSPPRTPDVYEMIKTMMSEGVRSHDVHQSCIKLKVCPCNMDIVGQGASARLLVCPVLHMDAARANKKCCQVNSHGELINSRPETHEQDSDSFKMYLGTCSSTPMFVPQQPSAKPNSDPPSPQYWETQSVVGVASDELQLSILETGVSEEGKMDKWYRACNQFRSWCVRVWSCDRHQGRICTIVYREGERGRCLTDTMPHSPGAQATLHYGVVLDVERGRLGFIDLDREVVLAKIDVEIREPLYPMFGVVPKSSECTVNMKLICGEDITMTAMKKSLIYKVLTQ